MDRTDWKSYILPLLFFKRICDVWDEEYQEAVETYGEDFADEHRFQLPEDCHWNVVRETPAYEILCLPGAPSPPEVVGRLWDRGLLKAVC
jgi:type I restriction-modification system DNA methylase subunit